MKLSDNYKPIGAIMELIDIDTNEVILSKPNTVLNVGKAWLASRMKDNTYGGISHIKVGTDGSVTIESMTDLVAELNSQSASVTIVDNILTITAIFYAGVATGNWKEAGIFTDSGAIILDRVVFNYVKAANKNIAVKFRFELI